jgi:chemotaxis protein histidine kinase CheA
MPTTGAAAERKKALEDARLAEAERAKALAQAKADAEAKAAADAARKAVEAKAEQERMAAERKKAEDAAKAAEAARAAERMKAEADARAAEAERTRAAAEAKLAEAAKTDSGNAKPTEATADDKPIGRLAALTPPDATQDLKSGKSSIADLPRLLQVELKRVGCSTGGVNSEWNSAAQKSLGLFNKNARTKFDVKVASIDALDSVKSRGGRVCPLVCDYGYRADGENCVKIICGPGYELGDDNSCERIVTKKPAKPVASQPPEQPRQERRSTQGTGSARDIEANYARCRAQAHAEGGGGGRRSSFGRIEACARNGGRL